VKFFFDNNLPILLAHGIRELARCDQRIATVCHLADRFERNTTDIGWMKSLAEEGRWIVISQDAFRKNDLERDALRKSGLIVFVLDRQWAQQSYWPKASNLVKWWPSITDQSARMQGGAAFRVPWRHTGVGQFKQIPL
jgi:hypothetical protein